MTNNAICTLLSLKYCWPKITKKITGIALLIDLMTSVEQFLNFLPSGLHYAYCFVLRL